MRSSFPRPGIIGAGMVLNLIALACMAGAVVAAVMLFRRRVRRPGLGGDGDSPNFCLRCGWPAEGLTSFTCAGCGHDVREAGVGPRRGRSVLALFWTEVAFTCLYLVLAMIATGALVSALPRVHVVSRTTSMTVSLPEIRGVELTLEGRGPSDDDIHGTLTGELYGAKQAVVLEVDRPGGRWRLLDMGGRQLDAGDGLDAGVIDRWIEQAGAPTQTPDGRAAAAYIAEAVGQLAGRRIDVPPVVRSLSYSSTGGGGSSSYPDRRWLPLTFIVAAALWLAGVYLILLSHGGTGHRREAAAPIAAAAGEAV
jgi:hypothetical protein